MNDSSELITYDVDELKSMETDALLIQIIAREDLKRPNRQYELRAAELHDKLVAEAKVYVAEMETFGIPKLTEAMQAVIAAYEGGD